MADYIDDLGSLPLDDGPPSLSTGSNARYVDTADNGVRPEGMQMRHEDDEEGGEGEGEGEEEQEDEEDDDEAATTSNINRIPRDAGNADGAEEEEGNEDEEGDEEDEDEDEDEEDEDDEDDDEEQGDNDRPRKKKRRFRGNKYVDIEVEVDEDEEDEDDEAGEAGFEVAENYLERPDSTRRVIPIADSFADEDDDAVAHDDRDHRQLERRVRDKEEAEALRIARDYKERHRQRRQAGGIGAMQDFAPKSVLMPGVNDPSIWCIKCKIGRERELVMSISRKAILQSLSITSAFQRDSFHGHLYVEARSEAHVREAVHGLVGIYISNAPTLVPIEEMPDLMKSRRKETPLAVGGWVRIKRGTYKGDLAQVEDVPEGGELISLKVVPRIDLNPREEKETGDKKRRRPAESSLFRPPPKFFNADEVRTAYAGRTKVTKDAEGFHFQNEIYANGYLIKEFRVSAIDRENVNPTIDEITRFMGETAVASGQGAEDGVAGSGGASGGALDLNLIANAAKQETVLQPGDYVEIFEGSQKGIIGLIDSVSNNVLLLAPTEPSDLIGTKIEVLAHQVRKRFKNGDHVKVLRGKNVNESGLVLKVKDDLVTFLSDLSVQEVTVFSKDIREAAEVGAGATAYGQYELHDLVQLDAETTGVIFRIEPDTFRILDQSGTVRLFKPSQIGNKVDTRRTVATDSEGYELRTGDLVKEVVQGTREPRQGRVLHVWRSLYAFLHNRDINENGGVFVSYARNLGSLAPRSSKLSSDLSKMNPDMAGAPFNAAMASGMMGSPGDVGRGQREYAVGAHVTVVKGNHKGYKGIVKDMNGPLARVELHTNSKTITIERNKLGALNSLGKLVPLEQWEQERSNNRRGGGRGGDTGGYNSNREHLGPRRPGQTPTGNTPNSGYPSAYATGKTPQYRGGATPFGGGFGGATPYNGGSATPFATGSSTPYAPGRTPAYGGVDAFAASTRTPYVASGGNAFNASSRTPYAGNAGASESNAWGGSTPYGGGTGRANTVSSVDAWGSASPARPASTSSSSNSAWGSTSPVYKATSNGTSNKNAWSSAATPANDAWGSTSPAHVPMTAPSPWASTGPEIRTPYISAPTPSAPTPYTAASTPAGNDSWNEAYTSAPTPAASAPTPYASAATPATNDAWD